MSTVPTPLHVFNFEVKFVQLDAEGQDRGDVPLCSGRFSEVSGLEATMEPKAIRVGGRNYGAVQRAGMTTFATVILKRGVTRAPDLWTWFELVAKGKTGVRLRAELVQLAPALKAGASADGKTFESKPVLRWSMKNALPVKFKAATFNASASDVGVEELHFVHEELRLELAGGEG